ncbi:hypothetical protein BE04_20370 [Sorangium cellulosum]|uniref:Wadjet protein JetD C-terminal domain-containing protein n=1 Tax=Sorangium cellulosum TaxID=56 RepID=A0A150PQA4_SORCE|nr:hypothetical protein BE04_20370 [Sorangium cellulosum]
MKAGLALEGTVRAALLVENLGAFCDLAAIDGWLFVHVAGWDTATVTRLLERLTHAAVVHFGDLDPNGVRIFRHLRGARPDLRCSVLRAPPVRVSCRCRWCIASVSDAVGGRGTLEK